MNKKIKKPVKAFYSASYKDVSIAQKLKKELENYQSLSITEKTALIAKAKKYGFLDLVSYYIKEENKDSELDKSTLIALSKLSLNTKPKKTYLSKPVLFAISIIIAIFFVVVLSHS